MATWLCRAVHERRGLHADSLLWSRDLLVRGTRGAVDIPRLIEGHVALQAFTVVTKTPRGLNFQRNAGDSDNITMLALVERWPPATWSSLTERALYRASRLRDFESRSQGKFTIVRSAAGLRAYLDRRRTDPAITAGFLGIEGAHALDGNLANIDRLYDAGFRMMAPTHLFDNDIGRSSAGVDKGGLTDKGREMVRRMEARHMLVDLAHGAVPLAAVLGNLLHDIGVFRAALKQHVLQQVRHAAFAVAFVILVADDEVLIRNLVTLLLQHEEYFVLSAADGHEGLELSRKYPGPIDLVITSPKWLATAGAAEDQRRKE